MEDKKVVTVSGFAFDNPTTGEEALKEQEAIEYVNKQLNFDDTKSLLALYNQMVTRRMFHTEVGISYLKSIQDYLMKSDVDPAVIEAIPITSDGNESVASDAENVSAEEKSDSKDSAKDSNKDNSRNNRYDDDIKARNRERKLIAKNKRLTKMTISFIVISIALVITVVAMFVIANTSNNPTILNYEEVLQNKYASWEQDLQRREAEVEKQEKALNKK